MTTPGSPGRRSVSVVVRAFNEGRHIGRLLEGLAAQTTTPDEVIVVDSGSTDDTVAIAESAGARIVHIAKSEFSFGRSLNRGCAAATGDVLLIVSAHVYPVYDTYLEHMLVPFDHVETAIAYGRQVGDDRTKFSEARILRQWFPGESVLDQGHPFSNNASAAVRRDVWRELRYDETLTGLEDLEFAQRAIQLEHRVAYVADAPVVHVHEESWSAIKNRYRREAVAYTRIIDNAGMGFWKSVGLAIANVVGDYAEAVRARRLWGNLLGIPRFRFAQFAGAWQGFRTQGEVSEALLHRFYYPPDSKVRVEVPSPGQPIPYTSHYGERQ